MEKHLETKIGVYALLIKDKKILLLHKPNDPIWCPPGGRMNEEEPDHVLALHRETKEEIGHSIKVDELLDVRLLLPGNKNHRLAICHVCYLNDEEKEIVLSHEHDDHKFFTFNDAVDMMSKESRGAFGIELLKKLKDKHLIE